MATKQATAWEQISERLEADGWAVKVEKVWLAEARKEDHIEQATGRTREEAFQQLCQMTLQDSCEGCP